MPGSRNLSLGGISISLVPDQISGEYEFEKRASEFHGSYAPDVILQIHCGWFPESNNGKIVFESGLSWQMLQDGDKWIIRIRSPEQDPYQLGIFPPNFRSGEIYVAPAIDNPGRFVFPLSYPLGELYMMNLLGTGLGVLFHACGIIYQGEGYLFTGHGSAGKTTTARLWQGLPDARIVNDDKVIVRKQAGRFYLYGTPWHGEGGMVMPASAPLKRIFILKKALKNSVAQIEPVQATADLVTRGFIPLWDSEKMAFILSFFEELCQKVPCQELSFLPDASAVDFVLGLDE
jgi:hypothetical protein